jgi:hypothetical protein
MDVNDVQKTGLTLAKMLDLNIREFYLDGMNLTHPNGTSLELVPRNTVIRPSPDLFQSGGKVSHETSFHIALTSPLSPKEIQQFAGEAGWLSQDAFRGPDLPLVEVYVENRFLFEVYSVEHKKMLDEFVFNSAYYQRDEK